MRVIAVDTETVRGEPWSIQTADEDHPRGAIWYCDNQDDTLAVCGLLEAPDTLTILHNAKFDLRVLGQCGIHPAHSECTMQMAYLLGEPALSLKVLAYRIAGIEMRTFAEVTHDATQAKAYAFLLKVVANDWPDPDPIMLIDAAGEVKFSFPKNITGKVEKLLLRHIGDPFADLYAAWKKWVADGMDGGADATLGRLDRAYLDEVDPVVAEEYACLDADATFAIYPYLHTRIAELGLQETLERDMGVLPMIMAMEDNGVLVDLAVLEELGQDLDELTKNTQADINYLAGQYVNPRSSQQVVALLQDKGIYTDMETSTDASVLDQYRTHPIVGRIQDYRAYTKLQSTYVRGLMKKIGSDGRIHTTLSTTRTETGRLASSNPNEQNIPVRTELGRRIRQAFVSERSEG